MTCFVVNRSFIVAMLGLVAGGILQLRALRNRAPGAPPRRRYWYDGLDLYRPNLFTERGNQLRRLSLAFTWTGAAFLLVCLGLIFTLRGDRQGLCWFQS
jgi:hypothetical protein